VQDDVCQSAEAMQAVPVIKVSNDRTGAGLPPGAATASIAQQGKDAGVGSETDKDAAGNVPAADDQNFLHAGIVAEH